MTCLRHLAAFGLMSFAGQSWATSGPWTGQTGMHNVYVGGHHASFSDYVNGSGTESELPGAIRTRGAQVILSSGVARDTEIELSVPFVMVSSPDGATACGSTCEATNAVGTVQAQYKYRLINEGEDGPVTLSAIGALRSGALHAGTRGRLTNAGDGATDVGAGLAVGRYSAGTMTYWVQAEGAYFYRFPLGEGGDGQKIPSDEVVSEVELGIKPHHLVGIAGAMNGFWRMGGQDVGAWADGVPTELQWASLDASQIMAGGKVMVSPTPQLTLVVGAFRTVAAKNNPTDNLVLSGGAGLYLKH